MFCFPLVLSSLVLITSHTSWMFSRSTWSRRGKASFLYSPFTLTPSPLLPKTNLWHLWWMSGFTKGLRVKAMYIKAKQAVYNGIRKSRLQVPSRPCLWNCSLAPLPIAPASPSAAGAVLTSPSCFLRPFSGTKSSSSLPIVQSSLAFRSKLQSLINALCWKKIPSSLTLEQLGRPGRSFRICLFLLFFFLSLSTTY